MKLKSKSFSLVEVMTVIVAIGLLAAIAIPNYAKSALKAHERVAIGNLTAIRSGVQLYVTNSNGAAVPVWADLNALNSGLGLSISDTGNTGYKCDPAGGGGVNRCRVIVSDGSILHFHFNGAHNLNGSIHCGSGPCPSCPANPGDCG